MRMSSEDIDGVPRNVFVEVHADGSLSLLDVDGLRRREQDREHIDEVGALFVNVDGDLVDVAVQLDQPGVFDENDYAYPVFRVRDQRGGIYAEFSVRFDGRA